MNFTFQHVRGRNVLTYIIMAGAAFLLSGLRVSMAFQAIDLDKALRDKPAQNRALSYYHYSLSKWFEEEQDFPRALQEMQRAVQYSENAAGVHVGLAQILARMNRNPEAIEEAKKAASLEPKNPEPHWILAMIHLRSAEGVQNRQAMEALTQAVRELEIMKGLAPDDQRVYSALGGCYMELGQPEKAIAAYERWQVLVPEGDHGYIQIAEYYEREGKHDKAIEYLEKAVQGQPESVQSMVALAGLYAKAKRGKDAIPLYRKIIDLTGGNPEIRQQLASALLDAREFSDALDVLTLLEKEGPQEPYTKILMARAQVGLRRFSEAITNLKSYLSGDPNNIEALFYLGNAYGQNSQPAEAAKIFAKLIDETREGPKALQDNLPLFQQHLAISYQDMGESQKAIGLYEEIVKTDPSPRSYSMLINAYRVDRQFDKALSIGKQQLEKNPRDADIALVYARSLADGGKPKEGAEILDKLLQSEPANLDIYLNLSQIYVQAKRFGEAEKVLRRAEERKLDKERVWFQLAAVYEKQKDYDRAESLFKEILKENPKDGPTLNYIGYMLADRGVRLEEAVRYVEEALVQEPNNPAYLDSLGWAFFKMNDLQKAEKYLVMAGELEKKDPVIQDHIGDLYFKTGNLEKAQEFWKKSLGNGGEPEDIQKVRGKLEKVQELLRKKR